MKNKPPEKCSLWTVPLAESWKLVKFDVVKTYFNEIHDCAQVLKCQCCGQLYYYEFRERVNFNGGNDDQDSHYVPFDSIELADAFHLNTDYFDGCYEIFKQDSELPKWILPI